MLHCVVALCIYEGKNLIFNSNEIYFFLCLIDIGKVVYSHVLTLTHLYYIVIIPHWKLIYICISVGIVQI